MSRGPPRNFIRELRLNSLLYRINFVVLGTDLVGKLNIHVHQRVKTLFKHILDSLTHFRVV